VSDRPQTTATEQERAVLVGAERPRAALPADESLAELGRLAETAGVVVAAQTLQPLRRPNPATFVGRGKVEEIRDLADAHRAGVVIFDDSLSPAQQRNLERETKRKIVDRSALILDIFARRARSLEGKMQVELAQLQYLLPRLTRAWTHLSRQVGGVGMRGPGETQLEVDRRRVRERIAQLRRRLADVERTRGLHRHERAAVPFPTVALVGYTNAGKSTLMNALTSAGVFVEDKLFATLDPTVRRIVLPAGQTVLLADTVGFIHKLPHQLVEAFKSTLEEVRSADLLVHVIDVSHPHWEEQAAVVEAVLAEIGADALPTIRALNKVDVLPRGGVPPATGPDAIGISARTGTGIPALLVAVEARLGRALERVTCTLPSARGDLVAWLRRSGRIVDERYDDGVVHLTALLPPKVAGQLRKRLPDGVPLAGPGRAC
jgi:GTPase